jgi:HAD superfamily hydrolase (TIGR01549 family)
MAVGAIFDIDGTLVTFRFDVRGTRKALLEELARRGYGTTGLDLSTPTQRILDSARAQIPPGAEEGYEELRKACFSILDGFEMESAAATSPFPAISPVLDYLRSKRVRMAVLSNSGRKAASEALRRADLLGYFEFVLTRDDTVIMKPSPDGVAMAADRLALPRSSIYYIGDSPFDIIAGKLAGVKVVSVSTGNYSAERLRIDGADHVITSIKDLPSVLGI